MIKIDKNINSNFFFFLILLKKKKNFKKNIKKI